MSRNIFCAYSALMFVSLLLLCVLSSSSPTEANAIDRPRPILSRSRRLLSDRRAQRPMLLNINEENDGGGGEGEGVRSIEVPFDATAREVKRMARLSKYKRLVFGGTVIVEEERPLSDFGVGADAQLSVTIDQDALPQFDAIVFDGMGREFRPQARIDNAATCMDCVFPQIMPAGYDDTFVFRKQYNRPPIYRGSFTVKDSMHALLQELGINGITRYLAIRRFNSYGQPEEMRLGRHGQLSEMGLIPETTIDVVNAPLFDITFEVLDISQQFVGMFEALDIYDDNHLNFKFAYGGSIFEQLFMEFGNALDTDLPPYNLEINVISGNGNNRIPGIKCEVGDFVAVNKGEVDVGYYQRRGSPEIQLRPLSEEDDTMVSTIARPHYDRHISADTIRLSLNYPTSSDIDLAVTWCGEQHEQYLHPFINRRLSHEFQL